MSASVGWFACEGRACYDGLAQLLRFPITMLLTYLAIVLLLLLKRFAQIHFGPKMRPDGSRAVIITGTTSGFGLDVTKRLCAIGFTVFACYYDNRKPGYKQLLDLSESTARASEANKDKRRRNHLFLIKMDVRSSQSIADSSREILKLLEAHDLKLHCLINNAAVSTDAPFELVTDQAIRDSVDTNIAGTYRLTKELVFRVIKDKGRVINVGSGMQYFPGKAYSLYGTSKAALAHFTESLHQDLKPYGAACYSIVPGNYIVHTNILLSQITLLQTSVAQLSDEERQLYKDTIKHYHNLLYILFRERLARSEDPKRLAKLYGFELSDEDCDERSRNYYKLFQRSLLVRLTDGSGSADENYNTVIDCYESAVTLVEPPRCIFAGNTLYQFLWGPILDHLPRSVTNLLALHVIGNL